MGVTTATLMVMMTVAGDTGDYTVMVTNAASPSPGVVSNPATLTACKLLCLGCACAARYIYGCVYVSRLLQLLRDQ